VVGYYPSDLYGIAVDPTGRFVFTGVAGLNGGLLVFDCAAALSLPMTIPLTPNRFHLISTHVLPDTLTAPFFFRPLESLVIAYNNNGGIYIPRLGLNTLGAINVSSAYMLFCQEEDTLRTPFIDFDPNQDEFPFWRIDVPDFLDPGTVYHISANRWSWIGYPFPFPRPVQEALTDMYEEIDIIMDDEGGICIPYLVDTIGEFQPGQGYYVYSHFDWDFQYYLPPDVDPWEGFPWDGDR